MKLSLNAKTLIHFQKNTHHMKPHRTKRAFGVALISLAAAAIPMANGATLTGGYTQGASSQLLTANGGTGSTLFNDSAALGGTDVNGTGAQFYSVLLDGSGLWSVGETVDITGIAMALINVTANGTFTFDIRQGAGGVGDSGAGGLASIGTADATFATTGTTSTYYVNFDSPVSFVADANSTSIVINWSSTASMRWKKEPTGGGGRLPQVNYSNGALVGGDDSVRFSVAGTVTPVPEPSAALLGGFGLLALFRRRRA